MALKGVNEFSFARKNTYLASRVILLVAGFFTLILSGMQSQAAPIEITFLTYGGQFYKEGFDVLVKEYNSSQNAVHVKLQYGVSDADIKQKYLVSVAGGAPPDVLWHHEVSTFASQGMLLPIRPLLKKEGLGEDYLNDFVRAGLERHSYQGTLYGIPFGLTAGMGVYLNLRVLDEIGVVRPRDGWTWDDFLTTAQKLTKDLSGDGIPDRYGFETLRWFILPWVLNNGGELFDIPTGRWFPDEDSTVESLQWLTDLINKHRIFPLSSIGAWWPAFANGKVCMIGEGSYALQSILDAGVDKKEVSVIHWPEKRTRKMFIGGYGLYLSATKSPSRQEAAWKFVRWLAEPNQQITFVKHATLLPSRGSVITSNKYTEMISDRPALGGFLKEIIAGRVVGQPNPIGLSDVYGMMQRNFGDAFALKVPAREAYERFRRESDGYYKKLGVPPK